MSDDAAVTGRRGIPPIAISETTTLPNHTGSWKYIRPVYRDRVAPCNARCPVGIDIEAYMNLLREGRVDEARALLLRENPMPAVTGRVCHHPCEEGCNRASFDDAVSIHAVERALGDLGLGAPVGAPPERIHEETVTVIGSGPAGLACAYHLAQMGYGVTVLEEAWEPGGMLRLGIPAYRLPREVLDRQIEHICAQGVEIQCGVRVGDDLPWTDLDADVVFIASGAHRSDDLGVKDEAGLDVRSGLEFLKQVNAGEQVRLGDRVVIVGGGNTAIDCARTALRLGSSPLVVYRRSRDEMPAIPDEVEEAEREGVAFLFLAAPVAVRRARGNGANLRGLECVRMELGPPDESGRRRPVPTDRHVSVPADTVLTAIGERPDLDFLDGAVRHEGATIRIDAVGGTDSPAVFAGGDATDTPRTVADALGSGKRAAIGIDLFLRRRAGAVESEPDWTAFRYGGTGNVSRTWWEDDDPVRRASPDNSVVPFADLNTNHFRPAPRHRDAHLDAADLRAGFREANRGLTYDEALDEAGRCFNCGVCNECELCLIFCPDFAISRRPGGGFEIDMNYCKGCGVCAEECPRGAMAMTKEGL